jgi:hypothetical protein
MRTSFVAAALLLLACGSSFSQASPSDGGASGDDSGSPGDDSGVSADGAPSTWCAAHAAGVKFCDDFDTSQTPNGKWDDFLATGNATLATNVNAPSPPNAFLAGVDRGQYVQMGKNFLTTPPTQVARLEFDLMIQKSVINDALSSIFIAGIDLPVRNTGVVGLVLAQSGKLGTLVAEASDAGHLPIIQDTGVQPMVGNWAGRLRVDVTFGNNPHVQVFLNGNAVGNAIDLPSSLRNPPGVRFELGMSPTGNTGPSAVAFDNVVADVK